MATSSVLYASAGAEDAPAADAADAVPWDGSLPARVAAALSQVVEPRTILVARQQGGAWHVVAAVDGAALGAVAGALTTDAAWVAPVEAAIDGRPAGLETAVVAPVEPSEGSVVGVVAALDERACAVTAGDVELVTTFAALLAQQLACLRRERELAARNIQLERLIGDRRRLLAEVAHDLRTPLAVVAGVADVLEIDARLDERGRSGLRVIRTNARRLAALVDGLLDAETRDAGEIVEEPTEVDLRALVSEVAAETRQLVSRTSVSVSAVGAGHVTTQREALRRVLMNLTANAVRFTIDGQITIAAERVEGGAQLTVSDTGRGMTADEVARFSEEYARGADSRGFGLGLAIVRRLARLLGAELEVTSQPRVGTTFRVRVPDLR